MGQYHFLMSIPNKKWNRINIKWIVSNEKWSENNCLHTVPNKKWNRNS